MTAEETSGATGDRDPARPSRRALPRWKRTLFAALIAAFVLVGVEALAWAAGSLAFGPRFAHDRVQLQRRLLLRSQGRAIAIPSWIQDEVLHPYVGFVPLSRAQSGRFGVADDISRAEPGGDELVIAIVGGSFADLFATGGMPHVVARMAELPAFRRKAITVLNAAASGHKAPQQLMIVTYLLALGQRIDILINLDGFNDVALHPTENAPARVFPAYPRRWHQRVGGVLSREQLRAMVDRTALEVHRRNLASAFSAAPWRALNTGNLVYLVLDARIERQLADADQRLLSVERSAAPTVATGPPIRFGSEREMLQHLADLWRRSSQAMHDLAIGRGVRYYHFLQPNQYVAGSKPMGAEERQRAVEPGRPYDRAVSATYPLLREAGRALRAQGIEFHDLTDAFVAHPEPLYIDSCCHVNTRGNRIVADRIFAVVAQGRVAADERTAPAQPAPGQRR